jgi:hypothetical protein
LVVVKVEAKVVMALKLPGQTAVVVVVVLQEVLAV